MQFRVVLISIFTCLFIPSAELCAQDTAAHKIEQLAGKQIRSICPDCKSTIESKWIPKSLSSIAPSSINELQFEEPNLPRGYQNAQVTYSDGDQSRQSSIQLLVTIEKEVPVANRRILTGETISADDLVWKRRDITNMTKSPINNPDQLKNKAAGRLISKGNVLFTHDIQRIPIVEAGDNILLIYNEGGIEIGLECEARQAKAEGELLRVYNEETRKTYLGKVLSSEKVKWQKTL